jgi:hypothetical protein
MLDTVEIEIELPDDILLNLCLLAHEKDITLNQFCNKILKEYTEKHLKII